MQHHAQREQRILTAATAAIGGGGAARPDQVRGEAAGHVVQVSKPLLIARREHPRAHVRVEQQPAWGDAAHG